MRHNGNSNSNLRQQSCAHRDQPDQRRQHDVAGGHVGEKTNRQGERLDQCADNFQDQKKRPHGRIEHIHDRVAARAGLERVRGEVPEIQRNCQKRSSGGIHAVRGMLRLTVQVAVIGVAW